jgi:hypothetical protein
LRSGIFGSGNGCVRMFSVNSARIPCLFQLLILSLLSRRLSLKDFQASLISRFQILCQSLLL